MQIEYNMKKRKFILAFAAIFVVVILLGFCIFLKFKGKAHGIVDVLKAINADIGKLSSLNISPREKQLKLEKLCLFGFTLDDENPDVYVQKVNDLKYGDFVFITAQKQYGDPSYIGAIFISKYKGKASKYMADVRRRIISYALLTPDNTILYINAPWDKKEVIESIEYDMGNDQYISMCILPLPSNTEIEKLVMQNMEAKVPKEDFNVFKKLHRREKITEEELDVYKRHVALYYSKYLELNIRGKNVIKYDVSNGDDANPFQPKARIIEFE